MRLGPAVRPEMIHGMQRFSLLWSFHEHRWGRTCADHQQHQKQNPDYFHFLGKVKK